jgi:hypothetical protein
MPEHGGKIQIEDDGTAIREGRTAIAREGKMQRLHNGAREG